MAEREPRQLPKQRGWKSQVDPDGSGERGIRIWPNQEEGVRRGSMSTMDCHGNSRAKLAGPNRRMRKTACPVVWEE